MANIHNSLAMVFDTLSDFAPGLSLMKDLVTISTGVNPVTLSTASDLDITFMTATLMVPSVAKYLGRGVAKAADLLGKIALRGGRQSERAKKLLDSIRKSEHAIDDLIDDADCLVYEEPSIWKYFNLVSVAYACPGITGKSADVLEGYAKSAGVTEPKNISKYAELSVAHQIKPKTLSQDQNKRLGDVANGSWTPHDYKHTKARTEQEAKLMSGTGLKIAQYLPRIGNKALEEKTLIFGQIISRNSGYHALYKFDDTIGYVNGEKTRWIRAEISSGTYHGHPRDLADVRKYIPDATK